ncbi:Emopamil binding protein-domain-containing protein [Podospora fimiseda]|uniref:Emopamil binding protein-domain-containing protein n=1 Tax=Podospora fimiseda TaxID=252190 RepID=A0AAN7BR82_9PEZI|nr:Emopamil binding protein-domain-containing protein [Podospora fimiseda]
MAFGKKAAPPSVSAWDLIDQTTIISLFSTVAILGAAWGLSLFVLDKRSTSLRTRLLFIWHAFDALIHFVLEGGFVYNCLFSSKEVRSGGGHLLDPEGYLGRVGGNGGGRSRWITVGGAQAGGEANWLASLWMVYGRADRRWVGVDLTVVSIEIITVLFAGSMAVLACYDIAKRNPRKNLVMIILATAEIYGGYMTFMPEWLSGSPNLDTSNFMFKWIFLAFFNGLWVVIPAYAIYVASEDIMYAFKARDAWLGGKSYRREREKEKERDSDSISIASTGVEKKRSSRKDK